MLCLILLRLFGIAGSSEYPCNPLCKAEMRGNQNCDLTCMTKGCNYDSKETTNNDYGTFYASDCFASCRCNKAKLINGICDSECNNIECGFDLGECGYCASGCLLSDLFLEYCKSECWNEYCRFDSVSCSPYCAPGCLIEDIPKTCKRECLNKNCLKYKPNFCEDSYYCAPMCSVLQLMNERCDSACNNAQCFYDFGSCDCSPGCRETSENCFSSKYYIEPCDTKACGYKDGKCGYCASGCFEKYLGDGTCQPSCNNEFCNYDNGDCECAPGCSFIYDPLKMKFYRIGPGYECSPQCLVLGCNFGIDFCSDSVLVKAAAIHFIIYKDAKKTMDLTECLKGGCTSAELNIYLDGAVYNEKSLCFTKNCAYCLSKPTLNILNCGSTSTTYETTDCDLCRASMNIAGFCYNSFKQCPYGYEIVPNLSKLVTFTTLCLKSAVHYSNRNYKIFNVFNEADEKKKDNYSSLHRALLNVYAAYTQILILSEHNNLESDNYSTYTLAANILDPLNIQSMYEIQEIWIIGSYPKNVKTKIYLRHHYKFSPSAKKFFFKNIEFKGDFFFKNYCIGDLCHYCPYATGIGNANKFDDKNEPISQFTFENFYSNDCSKYSSVDVFTFINKAYFEDVTFYDFRYQYNSFIRSSGTLILKNVNFFKMQSKPEGSIIMIECSSEDCFNTSFTYDGGFVSDLGAGYNDGFNVTTGSFLKSFSAGFITIKNVIFNLNFAHHNPRSPNNGFLLYSKNHQGTIIIKDCEFMGNYVNHLIYIDVSSLIYTDYKTKKGISSVYSQTHFLMQNVKILHTYCSKSMIYYLMNNVLHNIEIINLQIESSIVGNQGLISIINTGNLEESDINGDFHQLGEYYVEIKPRKMTLDNINISNTYTGKHSLYIEKYPNIKINNFVISNIEDGGEESVRSIVDFLKNYDNSRYFTFVHSRNIPSLKCNEMLIILNSINLFINSMRIENIKCDYEESPLGISLENITGMIQISNLNLTNIEAAAKSGIALTITDSGSVGIENLRIFNVSNIRESVLKFDKCNEVRLDTVNIETVSSNYSPAFILSSVPTFSLSNFAFTDMSTEYHNGGCLNILVGVTGTVIEILSGNFNKCISSNGKGGAIFLDSISRLSQVSLKMHGVDIIDCSGDEGAAIYISSTVSFVKNDGENELVNLLIKDNSSKGGGTISDYHYSGYLKMDTWEMINNSHGIYVFYSNQFPVLEMINLNIDASSISNSVFYLNSLVHGSLVKLQSIKINDSSKLVIEAYNIKVSINEMLITHSFQAIYISNNVDFQVNRLQVSNNEDKTIIISKNCSFSCNDCEFKDNLNTIVEVGSNSNFSLIDSKIFSNVLNSGYLIYLFSADSKKNSLINCQIYSNLLYKGNIVYLSSSTLIMKNCSIVENEGIKTSIQAIYSFNSILNIYTSRFHFKSFADYSVLIYAVSDSVLFVENTIFENSRSLHGNIYGSNIKIDIKNSFFYNNTGGDVFVESSDIKITDSIFEGSVLSRPNSGVVGMINNLRTIIYGTSFRNISFDKNPDNLAYIYDDSSKQLEISNCTLIFPDSYLMAVYAQQTLSLNLNNTTIRGFVTKKSSAFSAISIEKGCKLSILNSVISNNLCEKSGGGVYSENYDLTIENTEISFNSADESGGGVYFSSPNCDDCGIYLLGTTKIFENSCIGDGGAIKWKDYKPYKDESVLIFNNSAAYGSDFASLPAKFGLSQGRLLSDSIIITLSNIQPGGKINEAIEVYIYDTYGQVIKTENSITATLVVNATKDSTMAISGISNFKATNGVLKISDFILTGKPGSSGFLRLDSDNTISSGARNDDTEYMNSAYIQVELRNCTKGEQIQASACIDCIAGKYTLKPSENCLTCPTGTFCSGGYALIVENGYWRSSLESDVIYVCDVFDACLKGTKENELGNCSAGYSGVLCKACDIGYSKISNGRCIKCPGKNTNLTSIIFLSFGIALICFLLVKTTLTSAFSPKALHSIYIKILTNYLQLVFIVTQFDLEWPSYVVEFFNFQRSTASVTDQLFSLDCFLLLENSKESKNVYYTKLLIITAIPIGVFGLSYLYWIFYSFIKETYRWLKREVFTTIIVLFFLVYPTIVKSMFSNFSCIEIDKMKSYLNDNTSIECWDLTHKKFSFIVVIPSILLWVVGVPTILLILMAKNRRRLHLDYYRVVFGFLYNGYKQNRFYWEISIMYRKILLITITVFEIFQTRVLHALNLILVLMSFIYLHHAYRPYNSNQLNSMEMQALNIAAITTYFGLYYLSKNIGHEIKILLFILIVLGNSYFICYWVYYMGKALIDIVIKIFPRVRNFFKRGDAFEEDFNNEELARNGIYLNQLEGKMEFTLFSKDIELENENFEYRSIEDIYKEVAKRDIERRGQIIK